MAGKTLLAFVAVAVATGAALPARGDGETAQDESTTATCLTNSVDSANMFGSIKIAGTAPTAFVAVPFGTFGLGDSPILASNVVQAAALAEGDELYAWNGNEADEKAGTTQYGTSKGQYDVYTVDAEGRWKSMRKVTVHEIGSADTNNVPPDVRTLATGSGVFVRRGTPSAAAPIYVYGQVQTNAAASTTFAAGVTLVSPPAARTMAELDLNDSTVAWEGVEDAKTSLDTEGADYIFYRRASDGKQVFFHHFNGKWGVRGPVFNGANAKIPAGTAFWYCRSADGTATARW